jgi:lipopolysaccharide heptosyltransferase II
VSPPASLRDVGAPTAWDGARDILAVRLDAIGDLLMTTPALRALRSVDGTRVTLLTSRSGAAVARLVPEVDDVVVYEAPWMKHTERPSAGADLAAIERLRLRRFDAAVVFTVFSQSPLPAAMLCHLAEIRLRAAHCRENPYHLLTDWVRETEPERGIRHEVRRQLDLVAALGRSTADERLSLSVPAEARARVRGLLEREGLDLDGRWVLVHPGASAPSRRYPAERYADAVCRLARDGFDIVFSGSRDERDVVEGIRSAVAGRSWSLAARSDVAELAAAIELAPVLLTNNTGPAHVAAAVGTPVVDLYALTNPQHAPWRVPSRVLFHDVPCRNCFSSVCREGHHGCLRGVSPSEVAVAVRELYDETRSSGRPANGGGGEVLVPAGSEDP